MSIDPDSAETVDHHAPQIRSHAYGKIEAPGSIIGPYKLREQIGEGGFGSVWVAEQERPVRRRVALKIVKLGMDTREVIARFEQERQALAMMDHPNIARVFDAGATDNGRPYFVMELVRGVKITDYCDEKQLPTRQRIELFITVCQAVQHAHQKGIIHRDLKPSNILVTVNDGLAVPKIIDFGVAKATQGRLSEQTIYTQFQQMIGTPLYMSPEQADMTSLDVDTRSDIYPLGVLLYELLTGGTPIDATTMRQMGLDEMRRIIREVDPPRPSLRLKTLAGDQLTTTAKRRHIEPAKLPSVLRGDLDWIVMKCLEKDRTRRYDTANGLALDLQNHLNDQVITARPPTTAYLLSKLIHRNKLVFTAATAIVVALILGIIGTTIGLVRAEKERRAAEEARKLAEQRFQSARRFVDEVFQEVEPRFSDLIGASKAKEALARISLTFVESLSQPAQSDDAFQTHLAELYLRLADALGDPFDANSFGDYEAALRFAKRSLALWSDLSQKDPSNFERRRKIQSLESRIANLYWELGRYEEAKPLYQSALKRAEEAMQIDPDHARATMNLTIAHWNMGGVDKREGRLKQALEEHYLPFSRIWLERPLARPEHIDIAHECYVSHVLVADALLQLGRAEEALAHSGKSLAWVKIKLEMDPNNARAARDQSECLRLIGAAQLALGQTEPGTQSLDRAVRIAEDLVARDPANGPAQLEYIDALMAQAKGFATQAALPANTAEQQLALWSDAAKALQKCQERSNLPALQRAKLALELRIPAITTARRDAQLAIEKLQSQSRKNTGSGAADN